MTENVTDKKKPINYWQSNLKLLFSLLFVWFIVSFGCGILWVDWLDQFTFFGFNLGFWFAQQGSIYIFVILIFIYSWRMSQLEKKIYSNQIVGVPKKIKVIRNIILSSQFLTYIFVGLSFALYIGIALWSRASSTRDFYVAGGGVNPVVNGMATAADWMSAASFISMAGIISFMGRDGSVYLMGWTGGYVLLALLLAPYLRKFGRFTVPDFIGERYYSKTARVVAVICLIFISFTYVAGQMRGVGIVFSRFLEVEINTGVIIGMGVVFFYAVLGGMKGITYTQVAQYCVLIFAYLVPAIFISIMVTGNVIPQIGFGSEVLDSNGDPSGLHVLEKLDRILVDLGFNEYTQGSKSTVDVFAITAALMLGTAGLPHVLVRFFTVPKVSDARKSAGYALAFIALLYTTAPAVSSFARLNLVDTIHQTPYEELPPWFSNWEKTGLVAWQDKNSDGILQYGVGDAFIPSKPHFDSGVGDHGQRLINNEPTNSKNELYIDRDIMVLANPEIANLPAWVIALVAARWKKTFKPNINERQELRQHYLQLRVFY